MNENSSHFLKVYQDFISHLYHCDVKTIPRMNITHKPKKCKALPVTGREGYETSRLPHFLQSRLTDGGEAVILTRRQAFTPQEDSW
jgi:hypothetical protein